MTKSAKGSRAASAVRCLTPRKIAAYMGLIFVSSVVLEMLWLLQSGGFCFSGWCQDSFLQGLRSGSEAPKLEGRLAHLATEDPGACISLSRGHLETKFVQDDACWNRRQVQRMLIDLVGNFTALMNHHNLSYWVDSGTLLGAVRHQGLIPYDQDSDFGIDEDAYAYIRDNRIDVPAPYVLHVWNSSVNDRGNRDEPLPIRLINSDSGLYSDVFVFKRGKDRYGRPLLGPIPSGCFGACVNCDNVDGKGHFEIPRDWIFPVVPCAFEHFNTSCPRESIKYVEYMFGEEWTIPK